MNKVLEAALKAAVGHVMTPEERFEQAVSWCYGQLPADDPRTIEDVREQLRKNLMRAPEAK